jgi:WD40 repeat protein
MPIQKQQKETFELYSRLPEGPGPKEISFQDWLVNNGETYTHTATVLATSVEEAYGTLQEKRRGHGRKARFATVHAPQRLQALGRGDVLIAKEKAWMILADDHCEPIPYETNSPLRSHDQNNRIHCLTWSPDGAYLAANGGGQIRIHAVVEGKKKSWEIPSYERHKSWTVFAVAWSPDGVHLASGGYDDEVHLWRPNYAGSYERAAKGSILICRVEGIRECVIRCLVWASDSSSVFAGRADGDIVQWHAVTGAFLFHSKRHDGDVTDLALSPSDTITLASASNDTTVHVWRPGDPPEKDSVYRGHTHEVLAVAWSPDGKHVVSGGKEDRHLHVWNPQTGEVERRIPLSISFPGPFSINSVAWSPTGRVIAAGCGDGTLQLVDGDRMQHVLSYRTGNTASISSVAWSPDGWVLASGGDYHWGSKHTVEIRQVGVDLVVLRRVGKERGCA